MVFSQGAQLGVQINGAIVMSGSTTINDLAPHHVAVTWDSATGAVKGFLDGVKVLDGVASPGQALGGSGAVVLGQDQDRAGGGFDARQSLIGAIGDVNLFGRAFDEAEAAALADGAVDLADRSIVAAYRFDAADQTFKNAAGGPDLTSFGVVTPRSGPANPADVLENGSLDVFGLKLADVDVGATVMNLSLEASSGSVDVDAIAGVTVVGGALGTGAVKLAGTLADLNAALATLTYRPDPGFIGADRLTIEASDGGGTGAGNSTAARLTLDIVVNAVNDAPVAADDAVSGNEDSAITGDVLADNGSGADSDGDGDALSVAATPVTNVANGSLVLNTDGTFSYTPDANFNGTDSFVYRLLDGQGGTDTGTVTITVNAVNDAPTVADVVRAAPFEDDAPFVLDLLAGAADIEGDTLAVSDLRQIAGDDKGVSIEGATLRIDPGAYDSLAAGATEVLRYVYDVSDGNGGTVSQAAIIRVRGLNDAPVALNDVFRADEDTVVTGNVLADNGVNPDRDVDGDALTVSTTLVTAPGRGVVVMAADGSFTYTPDANFNGTDRFVYTLDDGQGGTDTAAVRIILAAVNDAPTTAGFLRGSAFENGQPIVLDLLAGAADVDGDALRIENLTVTLGDDRGVAIQGGELTVDPTQYASLAAGETEVIRYDYTISDGDGGTVDQAAIIRVRGLNDAPVAREDRFFFSEDTVLQRSVLTNNGFGADFDPNGDALTVSVNPALAPVNGALTLRADGSFEYRPDANFVGVDRFDYVLSDGKGGTAIGTVRLTVRPVNDAPTAADDTFSVDENRVLVGDVLADNGAGPDTDIDGDALTVVVAPLVDVQNGVLALSGDGSFRYTPNPGFSGFDSFTYQVLDGQGGSDAGVVTITVNNTNDAPTAAGPVAVTALEDDASLVIDLLAGAQDTENDPLTVTGLTLLSGDDKGFVIDGQTLALDPSLYGGLKAGAAETVRYGYTISDGQGGTLAQTAAITIEGVNDAPLPAADSFVTDEAAAVSGNVLADNGGGLDSDPDGDALSVDVALAAAPGNGVVAIAADGSFTYTPDEGFAGVDSFDYRLLDGQGGSTVGRATVTVTESAERVVTNTATNDVIVVDGETTLVRYDEGSTGSIFADLRSGIIRGDSSVGTDRVAGIFEVRATPFNDFLIGASDPGFGAGTAAVGNITAALAQAGPGVQPPPVSLLPVFRSFEGGAGNDLIFGGEGFDRASYANSPAGVSVDLSQNIAFRDGYGNIDTLFGIEGVAGTPFADVLIGDDGRNFFQPGRGADVIDGAGGVDVLSYARLASSIEVNLKAGFALHASGARATLANLENVETGAGDDNLTGDNSDNDLSGGQGADRIAGLVGRDRLFGGAGDDLLFGNSGDDILNGGAGNDRLIGSFGADTLIGGAGRDQLTGGQDADIFVFSPGSGFDIVRDFAVGVDRIDLVGFGFASVATLLANAVAGPNRVDIAFADGDVARLLGVSADQLDADDFIF